MSARRSKLKRARNRGGIRASFWLPAILSGLAAVGSSTACSGDKQAAPTAEIVVLPPLCPTGLSEDPPRSKQEPGIRAFEARDYAESQRIFGDLARQFPGSAAARAWEGDAVMFDKDKEDRDAARLARPFYQDARKLHESGCKLQRRPLYYLLMGEAYGALRLAKLEAGYDEAELAHAEAALEQAAREFPTSAEVPYNEARVACARAQNQSGSTLGEQLERCLGELEAALKGAERLDRPRFLRTHRSTQDWIVRSRTQSEFVPLRADARYQELIRRTLEARAE